MVAKLCTQVLGAVRRNEQTHDIVIWKDLRLWLYQVTAAMHVKWW